jgi:hypothetical protein
MQHPTLGELTFDEGIWSGEIERDGETIELAVSGNASGPDGQQLQRLLQRLELFDELKRLTFDFIDDHLRNDPDQNSSNFTIRSLDFLWPKQADYFMVWLDLEGDKYGAWKVEFVDGQPKYWSRDD